MRPKRLLFHESTQRRLCRFALFLFGVLPMVLCVGFAVVSRTSWYTLRQKAAWRERIHNNLGLDVVFDSIEFPTPNRFRIKEFMCIHPETQQPILHSPCVQGEISSNGWSLELDTAELVANQSNVAASIIHDSFLCRPHNAVPILKLSIGSLSVQSSSEETRNEIPKANWPRLTQILVEYLPSLDRSELKLQFAVGPGKQSPAKIHVRRNHIAANPRTDWAIKTQETSIPCEPLMDMMPVLARFGPGAMFRGTADFWQDTRDWGCELEGEFDRARWESLTAPLGSPLRGETKIGIGKTRIVNGHVQYASGHIQAAESVDGVWLQRIASQFNWATQEDVQKLTNAQHPVAGLTLHFDLNQQGLWWGGQGDEVTVKDQRYRILATVNNLLVATNTRTPRIALHQIGACIANSQANATPETIARWQSTIASILPVTQQYPRLSEASLSRTPR